MNYYEQVLNDVQEYLTKLNVKVQTPTSAYTAVGFRMEDLNPSDYREIVSDLEKIAPKKEFVHHWGYIYSITHIDDVTFPTIVTI